jgi:hypothetical protein
LLQTVVLIAVEGGVVELGTTDSFEEDLSIVHYVRDAFAGCKLLESSVAAPVFPEAAAHHGHYQNCSSDVQDVSYHPGAFTSCNESTSTSSKTQQFSTPPPQPPTQRLILTVCPVLIIMTQTPKTKTIWSKTLSIT